MVFLRSPQGKLRALDCVLFVVSHDLISEVVGFLDIGNCVITMRSRLMSDNHVTEQGPFVVGGAIELLRVIVFNIECNGCCLLLL